MDKNQDAFQLIAPEDAVGVLCLLVGVAVALWAVPEPKVAQPVAQAQPRCEVTVGQYAAGERYSPNAPEPVCAGGMSSIVELPNWVLSTPIQEKK